MKNSLLSHAEKMFQSLHCLLTKPGFTKLNSTFDALRKILSIKEKLSESHRKLKLHTKFTEISHIWNSIFWVCLSRWINVKNKTEEYQFIESVAQTIIAKDISEHEIELDDSFGSDKEDGYTACKSKMVHYQVELKIS